MYPSNYSVSDEELHDCFGTLLSIDADPLIALASKIRRGVEGDHPSRESTVSVLHGSYNLVHVIQFPDNVKYVIRVPATGWGSRLTDSAKRALTSQALTTRYIAEKTNIPVPKVYDFDVTKDNEIGAPYIAMSYVSGCTVSSTWFDEKGPTPLEERRRRILDTVARAACQLEHLRFHEIGSLEFPEKGKITIGPCFSFDLGRMENEDYGKRLQVRASGPFQSTHKCFSDYLKRSNKYGKKNSDPLRAGSEKIIDKAISYLPVPQNGRESFALSIPDFDSQNIMIGEHDNLTGIIDWDNVQTEPDCVGPCRYPSWITRDWDPLFYAYPSATEDAPHQLRQYRRHYHAQYLAQIKRLRPCTNRSVALKSHIFEAVAIAAANDMPRLEIVLKLVERALREDSRNSQWFVMDLGRRKVTRKDMHKFEQGLRAILSISHSF